MPKFILDLRGLGSEGLDIRKEAARHPEKIWGVKASDCFDDYHLGARFAGQLTNARPRTGLMCDKKFHDTLTTVALRVRTLWSVSADIITVHASGGSRMLRSAVESCGRAKIFAVGPPSSMTEKEIREIYGAPRAEITPRLAKIAHRAGAHGFVCSVPEIPRIKAIQGLKQFPLIAVGIREEGESRDDQEMPGTAEEAAAAGADFILLGSTFRRNPRHYVSNWNLR